MINIPRPCNTELNNITKKSSALAFHCFLVTAEEISFEIQKLKLIIAPVSVFLLR